MEAYIIIVLTVIFSAFFSGMEIAFVSANRLRVELESKQGGFQARMLTLLTKNSSRFIATMLVGNNIALVIFGIYMAKVLEGPLSGYLEQEFLVLLVQTLISTLIILSLAEFLPKALFRVHANTMLSALAFPVTVLYFILYLIVTVIMVMSNFLLRAIFGAGIKEEQTAFGRIDLDHFVKEHTENNSNRDNIETEVQIFQNALDFSKVKARECMVPRTEIEALEINDSMDDLMKRFQETGLSKILIYEENIDKVIGYTHSYELFKKPKNIQSILIPVPVVTETMPANDLLNFFIKERKTIALVVDEFGGTSGLVTIEDVIEEIFGEIEDEHDSQDLVEEVIGNQTYKLSARHEIDYLNERFDLNLPESDNYETLGGMLIATYERIPDQGDRLQIGNCEFTIERVESNRIDLVILRLKQAD